MTSEVLGRPRRTGAWKNQDLQPHIKSTPSASKPAPGTTPPIPESPPPTPESPLPEPDLRALRNPLPRVPRETFENATDRRERKRFFLPLGRSAKWILACALPLAALWISIKFGLDPFRQQQSSIEKQNVLLSEQLRELTHKIESLERKSAGKQFVQQLQQAEVELISHCRRSVFHIEQKSSTTHGISKQVGTGFLYDREGHILTNYHVIQNARQIKAFFYDFQPVDVKLVGSDPLSDIAILQILDRSRLEGSEAIQPLELSRTPLLHPGQFCYAIGSPKNLKGSVSRGIISRIDRYQNPLLLGSSGITSGLFNTWIQTDAAINKGNSGGPLIDIQGRVIGVVTRKLTDADGIGFAIPTSYILPLLSDILSQGYIRRSATGILLTAYRGSEESDRGVRIAGVYPRSPAFQARVRAGAVLRAIDGKKVHAQRPSDIVKVRNILASKTAGKPVELTLTVGSKQTTHRVFPRTREAFDDRVLFMNAFGFIAIPVTSRLRETYGVTRTSGLWLPVVFPNSPFHRAGIRSDDILIGLQGQPIQNHVQLQTVLSKMSKEKHPSLLIQVDRRGEVTERTLRMKHKGSQSR
ncbi:MAG: trypsin-like peptidase domain-containing protein [Planctomycetota bacterium]|nr:trypsin-like peptidase domain-containing protein [Planctomycetota bacterium]